MSLWRLWHPFRVSPSFASINTTEYFWALGTFLLFEKVVVEELNSVTYEMQILQRATKIRGERQNPRIRIIKTGCFLSFFLSLWEPKGSALQ